MALHAPHLGPRARLVLRVVGYIVLALVTFVFALQWTFPVHRVRDKVVEILSAKYEVSIGDVERGLMPGRIYFKAVTLRTRVTKPEDIATTFYIERLEVDVGLFALLRSTASVDIDAKIGPGHITGNISLSKAATEIHLVGKDLPSGSLPMREAIGLPMGGKLNFEFDLDLPNQKLKSGRAGPNWQKAEGGVMLACPTGCSFGDGKTKLKPKLKNTRNQAFAADGIEFGKVNIDSLRAKVDISKGQLAVKQFDAKTGDGELHIEFAMTLAQNFDESLSIGCLRFTGSQELLKREAKTFAAISTTGAPLGPDNLYHIRLEGKFKEMKRLGQLCGPGISDKDIDAPDTSTRPNLTIQPDEAVRPNSEGGGPPVNPPPPVAIDAGADAAVTVPVPGPENEDSPPPPGANGSGANVNTEPTPAPPPLQPEGER
ncbi:MAG: type II secretion system protein GspN [Myxococcota bacterium]|nr:type II secretion system protein GspN [Myxococcota bacterium]